MCVLNRSVFVFGSIEKKSMYNTCASRECKIHLWGEDEHKKVNRRIKDGQEVK